MADLGDSSGDGGGNAAGPTVAANGALPPAARWATIEIRELGPCFS